MEVDPYEVTLLVVGVAALIAAWAPAYTRGRPLSMPIVLVVVGVLAGVVGLPLPNVLVVGSSQLAERLTEAGVLVALLGAGLKIDRPFSWRTWRTTWRLLVLLMPLTVALAALAGWAIAGLGVAASALLGAALAPTDPVLASDVQVGAPTVESDDEVPAAEDEVRFALTSEGGLNDALAFPFVYLAIRLADGDGLGGLAAWFGWDVLGRTAIAMAVGWGFGRLLALVAFRPPGPLVALAETPQGFLAIAAILLTYGATELVHGYGFLAVFVAAVTLRSEERQHHFHGLLHAFAEQVENLLTVALLLLLGGAVAGGVLAPLTLGGLAVAVTIVFVVRPVVGWLCLRGIPMSNVERWAIATFGIRGFGSLYYLAYGLTAATFASGELMWSIAVVTILISVGVHGVLASPAMRGVDRAVERRRRARRLRRPGRQRSSS